MRSAPSSDPAPNGAWALWAGGVVILVALLVFGALDPGHGTAPFFLLLGLANAGYLAAMHQIARGLRPSGRTLITCALLAAVWRVPLVLAPTHPFADVSRYVWDARVVRAGLSPYTVIPSNPAFARLRTAESWPLNNPDVPSPYPPGAQLFFLAATALRESALAVKTGILLCEALLAFVLWRWLIALGVSPGWMLGYLWNPLVSLEVTRQGHVDVLGALFLVLAALALVRQRSLLGSVAFALAVAVKPLPIVLVPLLWRRVSRRALAAGIAVLVALYLPFWRGGPLPIGSVPEVVQRFRFNGPVFVAVASHAGPTIATGLAVGAGLAVAAWARRRLPLASPAAWACPMAVALLCSPLVYPWYLVWLAPFLVAPATMPLALWTVSIQSTYVVWVRAPMGAPWVVPGWALLIEYGTLAAAALTPWRRRRAGEPSPSPVRSPWTVP
jgi:alpha-1,6-mannosyltransferase